MRITALLATTAFVASVGAIGVAGAPHASADTYPKLHKFGTPERLPDDTGTWRIDGLQPSTDVVAWPLRGKLWEANATVDADRGALTPLVINLNARADDNHNYPALVVTTPLGINPSTLDQGQTASGKLYFDVVGMPPVYVVYTTGEANLMWWTAHPKA